VAAPFTEVDIVRSLAGPLLAVDADGRVAVANPAAKALLGEQIASPGAALPLVTPELWQCVSRCLETGLPDGARLKIQGHAHRLAIVPILHDGRTVGASIQGAAPGGMLRPFVDDQLRSILDSVSDGIWICDGAGIILDINAASERLNSMQAGDYLGKDVRCIVSQGIVDRSATLEVLETKRQAASSSTSPRPASSSWSRPRPCAGQQPDRTGGGQRTRRDRAHQPAPGPAKRPQGRGTLPQRTGRTVPARTVPKGYRGPEPQMQRTLRSLLKLAQMDASRVLLLGESGTGKGLLAKFLHQVSPRSHKPFIQINCPAVPENLFEAELFGYERGAFTGARENGKAGLIELAQGGTLFLDEVGDIPLTIQAKLLKYLDDYGLRRLGGAEAHTVECRVAAATNCDLENLVERRLFRKDLYYRLNTFIVRIAPLRERREDIFGLAEFYLAQQNQRHGKTKRLSPRAMRLLEEHDFPGNVRELVS
jgi:transcriptional regulator with PAS, ATPase and Fis domain